MSHPPKPHSVGPCDYVIDHDLSPEIVAKVCDDLEGLLDGSLFHDDITVDGARNCLKVLSALRNAARAT